MEERELVRQAVYLVRQLALLRGLAAPGQRTGGGGKKGVPVRLGERAGETGGCP